MVHFGFLAPNFKIMNSDDRQPQSSTRPIAITVICILGFIGALVTLPLIFSDLARSIGA
jgi:hypothetical protein